MPARRVPPWNQRFLVSISEAAVHCGIGYETMRQLVCTHKNPDGEIPLYVLGKRKKSSLLQVRRADVDAYIESHKVEVFPRATAKRAQSA